MLLHLKKITVYFIFIAFVVSCGLKQPEFIPEAEIPVGSIYVTSNIPGARIYIDYDSTGKTTPDSLHNISVGIPHIIHTFIDGYESNPDFLVIDVEDKEVSNANFFFQQINDPGKIQFTSNPSGALIRVDGKFKEHTPKLITVHSGFQKVTLEKNGFELFLDSMDVIMNDTFLVDINLIVMGAQVLIESVANISCLPCVFTSANIENFMASNNPKHYSLIEYFTKFPHPFDPMFRHYPEGNLARYDTLYGVNSVPAMFIAGSPVDAIDYNSIQNSFNNQLINASVDVSISLSKQITDSLKVNVELNEFNSLPAGDWRLFIAVIEKEVIFETPPGGNGLTKFSQVLRKFLTKPMGDVFTFSNNQFIKEYTASIHSEWDLNEIEIIGFIQNVDTKEVINSTHL